MRRLDAIPQPSQLAMLEASCGLTTECPLGYEVIRVHWGEDGPGLYLERTRAFNLADQEFDSGPLQDWYETEVWGAVYACGA